VYSNTLASFTPGHFTPGKKPQLLLNRGWVGPSNQPGCYGESNYESSDVQAYPEETGTGVVDSFLKTW